MNNNELSNKVYYTGDENFSLQIAELCFPKNMNMEFIILLDECPENFTNEYIESCLQYAMNNYKLFRKVNTHKIEKITANTILTSHLIRQVSDALDKILY